MLQSQRFYLITVAVILIVNMSYIDYLINKKTYLNEKLAQLEINFSNQINAHKRITDLFFSESIKNNEELKALLFEVKNDSSKAEHARAKLYNYFYNTYQYLSSKGFPVFHFHDADGRSFLRFHRPKKFGDSLVEIRSSIAQITQEHKPVVGLEIGVYNEEIRYLYPLFYQDEYIGSVEISYKPAFLLNELHNEMGGYYTLLFSKETVDNKIIEATRKNYYVPSGLPGYYVSKEGVQKNAFEFSNIANEVSHKLPLNAPLATIEQGYFTDSIVYLFTPVKDIAGVDLGYISAKFSDDMPNWILLTQFVKLFIWILILFIAIYIFDRTKKEQMRSEAILEQYKYAIDQSSIVSKTDPKGKITYVNDKFCQISGFKEEELIGQAHDIIRHPDSPDGMFKHMWKTILAKRVWRGVLKNRRKNGEDYYVQSTITPILDKEGNILEFIAIREDVTSIVEHRNQLKSDKQLKNVILDNLGKTLIIQMDDKILYANKPFYERFEYNDYQELNKNVRRVTELFISEDGMSLSEAKKQKIREKLLSSQEPQHIHMLQKDKSVASLYVSLHKVSYESGELYLFKIVDDINELLHPTQRDSYVSETTTDLSDYKDVLTKSQERLRLPDAIHKGIVEKFAQSTQKNMKELEDALEIHAYETIEHIAHNIKGSASTLLLEAIAKIADTLEEAAKTGKKELCDSLTKELNSELNKFVTSIEEIYA